MKLDFSQGIVTKVEVKRSENRRGIVKYINDIFYVQLHDKTLLPIEEECLDLSTTRKVYSKPTYTTYCDWTPKPFDKVVNKLDRDKYRLKSIMKYWSKYYEGQIVYGQIVAVNDIEYFYVLDNAKPPKDAKSDNK